MPIYDAKVTSKGQVTLPVEIRRLWNLKVGDKVDFHVDHEGGGVRVQRRNRPASALFEGLPRRKRIPGIASDDEGIERAVIERDARSRSKSAAE